MGVKATPSVRVIGQLGGASLSSVWQLVLLTASFVYAGQCSVLNVGIDIILLIVNVEVVGHRAVARLFRRL